MIPSHQSSREAALDPVSHSYVPALREPSASSPAPASRVARIPAPISDAVARERDLRGLCRRILGWSSEQVGFVDDAMHTLLAAAARGGAVALQGDTDLVPVAFALHRRLLGADRPFVVCDPRRREGAGSVRVPPNRNTANLALEAAAGGSVCIHSNRLPKDFDLLAMSFRDREKMAVLFVCLHSHDRVTRVLCNPVVIPPLDRRPTEVGRLLHEYLDEAALAFGVRRPELSEPMQQSIFHDVTSLSELEKVALRLVALRNTPNVNQAAQWLHMAPVSLNRWIGRRPWAAAFVRHPSDRGEAQVA